MLSSTQVACYWEGPNWHNERAVSSSAQKNPEVASCPCPKVIYNLIDRVSSQDFSHSVNPRL